jgi:predicted RNA binding protein YcfA (HicA-like mRNA interferase family)
MRLLGNISGKDAVTAFKKAGWIFRGQVGSHAVLSKPDSSVNLSKPQHKELGIGILRSLMKHSGFSIEDFRKLLP